jgi:hypothetical protein
MLSTLSPDLLAEQVTQVVYDQALELAHALGAQLGRPRSPRIARAVRTIVAYAQRGAAERSNDDISAAINSVIEILSSTCYEPATPVARAIFDRKAGEAQSEIDLALMAARARWDIELGMNVPIRWLAALGGVSVKTARNLASAGQLTTYTDRDGQVSTAREAARWLASRGTSVEVGTRRVSARANVTKARSGSRRS